MGSPDRFTVGKVTGSVPEQPPLIDTAGYSQVLRTGAACGAGGPGRPSAP
jgi:hypothetical protein